MQSRAANCCCGGMTTLGFALKLPMSSRREGIELDSHTKSYKSHSRLGPPVSRQIPFTCRVPICILSLSCFQLPSTNSIPFLRRLSRNQTQLSHFSENTREEEDMANATSINSTVASNATRPEYLNDPAVTILKVIVQVAIAVVGVTGNILVCMAILCKSAKMKSVMNCYLLSLAVSDLGILTVNVPIAMVREMEPFEWLLGKVACTVIFPTSEVFFGASIWSITAIAIERYRNIVGKGRFCRKRSLKPARIVIAMIWMVSFIVASVPMYTVIKYSAETKLCSSEWPNRDGKNTAQIAYMMILLVVWYILPLVVIIFTYVRISRTLQQSETFHQASTVYNETPSRGGSGRLTSRPSLRSTMSQNSKAQRILTPLVVLFAVAMLPVTVLRLAALFLQELSSQNYYLILFTICIFGVEINSAANPVIYYIVSKDFRRAFKEILNSFRSKRKALFCRSTKASLSGPASPRYLSSLRGHIKLQETTQFESAV